MNKSLISPNEEIETTTLGCRITKSMPSQMLLIQKLTGEILRLMDRIQISRKCLIRTVISCSMEELILQQIDIKHNQFMDKMVIKIQVTIPK